MEGDLIKLAKKISWFPSLDVGEDVCYCLFHSKDYNEFVSFKRVYK